MTDDTQPEALRALAEAAKWTGKWYDAGCNTVYCTYDKEDSILHDEIAHPVPFGVSGYIAAAHPQAVIALLDRIAELESELEAVGAGGVSGPLVGRAAPPTAQAEGWRPIETAPKDGALIVLGVRNGVWLGKYVPVYQSGYRPENPWSSMLLNHDHMAERYTRPTHWMPLPPPPTSAEGVGS